MKRDVQDQSHENPYRFGVLVGNHVEDRFGTEISSGQKDHGTMQSTSRMFHSKYSSLHNSEPRQVQRDDQFQSFKAEPSGVESHILFGHGPSIQNFVQRDFRSCYDLSYNDKVRAHHTIEPHFIPPPPAARPPPIEKPTVPKDMHKPKAYYEFTRRCDSTFNKIPMRKDPV